MKRKVSLKQSNIGMTLIELLVAVAIFVAAIVPMLYAFVYSTGFNFKAQQTMQSTGIAQAIIEKTKAANTNYGDIITSIQDKSILEASNDFTIGSVTPISGGYRLSNVRATHVTGEAVDQGNTSRRYYDVDIIITNNDGCVMDHSMIQSMSNNTANFVGTNFTQQLRNQDGEAKTKCIELIKSSVIDGATEVKDIYGNVKPDTLLSVFSEADINVNQIVIDRVITVTVKDDTVDCKVEYYYAGYDRTAPPTYSPDGIPDDNEFTVIHPYSPDNLKVVGDPGHHMSGGTPFYVAEFTSPNADGSVSFFLKSNPGDPCASAVFFYYFPGYRWATSTDCSFRDNFVIKNELSSSPVDDHGNPTNRLDFYLFKQYDDSNTSLNLCESYYDPKINLVGGGFDSYLYHNLYDHVYDESVNLSASAHSIANHPSSNFTVGTNWHEEMNGKDPYMGSLTYTFLGSLRNPDSLLPPEEWMKSALLSDHATIPYRHIPRNYGTVNMFTSRYKITVTVYPHGKNNPEDAIETMSGEFLNW